MFGTRGAAHRRRRSTLIGFVGLVTIAGLLSGCAANPGTLASPTIEPLTGDMSTLDSTLDLKSAASAADQGARSTAPERATPGSTDATVESAVIRTASLTLETEDPKDAADSITKSVTELGGRIEQRSLHTTPTTPVTPHPAASDTTESGTNRVTGVDLTIRIPDSALDDIIERLGAAAEIVAENRSESDVTMQKVDLTARVASLTSSIDRLTGLLDRASNVSELVEIENALATRQAELDSLTSQLDVLTDQVSYATVHVNIVTPGTTPRDQPQNFWEALVAGFASLLAAGSAIVVGAGFLLPWIVVIGLLAAVIIFLVRRRSKRPAKQEPPQV